VFAAAAFPSATSVTTDGERYSSWQPQAGTLLVRDERMRRTRTFAVAPGCGAVDGRHGIFLVTCNGVPRLVLPGWRTLKTVPGHVLPGENGFNAVGRRWIEARGSHNSVFYVDWRTGVERPFGDDDRPRDLDSRDLALLTPRRHAGCQYGSGLVTCVTVSQIEPLTVVTAYDSRTGERLRRWRLRTVVDSVHHTARYIYFNIREASRYDVHRVRWRR
jgi:hypothetical protein